MNKKLPKSIRKYIRKQKARIRREILNLAEQKKKVSEIYQGLAKKPSKEYSKSNQHEKKDKEKTRRS